jgi:indoleamine 2,3-dioxygenase
VFLCCGITGNTEIFGDGGVYEGCFDDKPQQFRGQSGSQDDIIPTEDILTGLIKYYPDNVLTQYLLDMRQYRPIVVQNFLNDLKEDCNGIFEKIKMNGMNALIKLLKIVDQIYFFRNGHWQFVQKYIMANTKYSIATGGTPITSWVSNQIEACLKYSNDIIHEIESQMKVNEEKINDEDYEHYLKIKNEYPKKVEVLVNQITELNKLNYDAKLVYNLNEELKETEN